MLKDENNIMIVIYDGNCGLCNYLTNFLIKRDKHKYFIFLSNKSEDYKSLLLKFNVLADEPDSLILIDNKSISFKSQAVVKIAKYLPFPWKMLRVLSVIPTAYLNKVYNYVAFRRSKYFYKSACNISSKQQGGIGNLGNIKLMDP